MIEKTGDIVVVVYEGNASTMSTAEFESLAKKLGYRKNEIERLKNQSKIYLNNKRLGGSSEAKKRSKMG